jgi:outer membrane protein assembly factor BamB
LGISAYTNIPTQWKGESGAGILWKTPVPLDGNSSPIVWGDRVFLTGANEEKRAVYSFDADSGKLLWQTEVPGTPESTAEPPDVGETTGFASPTPVTDGQRVYAMFANGDIAAVDFDGNVDWSRSLGIPKNVYGHAASLTMHQDLVIVQFDQGGRNDELSRLLGLATKTGETVWETPRGVPNSWSSPIVIQHDGKPQIITGADPWVIAYSATDGKEIWRAESLEADVGPSPVYADGVVFVANEFPGASAIRAGGTGNVTETHVVWESDIGAPDCCSPLATEKFLFLLASYGTLTCFDVKQGGEPLWEEDFEDANFVSSPSLVGKYVYLFGEEGRAWIVEPTEEECKRIAEASLGEGCVTSPAFQDGRLYIRGEEHLFCIGEK